MKNRKKQFIVVIIVVIAVLIACSLFIRYWKPLHWVHTVRAEDISRMEVAVQPYPNGDANTAYMDYPEETFSSVTEILNSYQGSIKICPQTTAGGYVAQYTITMADGKIHNIGNNGSELYIDKIAYKGNTKMLKQWLETIVEEVDSPVPNGFWKID